jgi:hypothetical protein
VRELLASRREQDDAINDYAYDLVRTTEELDKRGSVKKTRSRRYEVFHVRRKPVRMLVAEDGRPLEGGRRSREERRVRQLVQAMLEGRTVSEEPRARLGLTVERYDFRSVAREPFDGRTALRLAFSARPGARPLEADGVLRALAGRLWVDEAERQILRVEAHNTASIKVGAGGSLASLDFALEFHKVDDRVWLPRRQQSEVRGRVLLVKTLRVRTTDVYDNYRRFQVDSQQQLERALPALDPP